MVQISDAGDLLVSTLFQPELDASIHIPLLLVPPTLGDQHLLDDFHHEIASNLHLVFLVSDKRRGDDVDVAVSSEKVRVGRMSVGVVDLLAGGDGLGGDHSEVGFGVEESGLFQGNKVCV
jgi:hypothetical protein